MKAITVEEAKERDKNNRLELAKLIMENPDLELFVEADCDAFSGEWSYEIKPLGKASIEEYVYDRHDCIHYKSNDDVFDTVEECLEGDDYYGLPDTMDECRPLYEALPWQKAIIVRMCD